MGEHSFCSRLVQILAGMSLAIMIVSGPPTVIALNFTFSSFQQSQHLTLLGDATINTDEVVYLTLNSTTSTKESQYQSVGQLLYRDPITFKSSSGVALSFSTSFTFKIQTMNDSAADGMAFMIVPANGSLLENASGARLGLMTGNFTADPNRHFFAVEFDTLQNLEINDPSSSHIGIDINTVNSYEVVDSNTPPGNSLYLHMNQTFTVWIDYNQSLHVIELRTVDSASAKKPESALGTLEFDLSSVFLEQMEVGFSSSTDPRYEVNMLYNWEFSIESENSWKPLVPSVRPPLHNGTQVPTVPSRHKLPVTVFAVVSGVVSTVAVLILLVYGFRKTRLPPYVYSIDSGPREYSYRQLRSATHNFNEENYLGRGASASVYKGCMRGPKGLIAVAVKRMNYQQSGWDTAFTREIEILSGLRHPNIVKLQGWCHERDDAFLVYDYMSRGSLDRYLSRRSITPEDERTVTKAARTDPILPWDTRKKILLRVAAALEYLHKDHRHFILHRDVKAANVLLDEDWNACLGDFGFARLVDAENANSLTSVGTAGYAAPEIERHGQVTDRADVFSFGVLALEVVCGRRVLVEFETETPERTHLRVWVKWLAERERLVEAVDPRLRGASERTRARAMEEEGMALLRTASQVWCNEDPLARPSITTVRRQLMDIFKSE